MWTHYAVSWQFFTQLCGSVPADPELVKAWIDARKPTHRPAGAKSLDEVQEEVFAHQARDQEDETDSNILTFQREAGICALRAGTIKAHMKDCSRRIGEYSAKIEGVKSFGVRVTNTVYPEDQPYWIPILRLDGSPVTKHDGERDKPVRTWRGTALKRFEWIEPARVDFGLKVLTPARNKAVVNQKELEVLFTYGGTHGYGGERGDGEGKYTFTLTLLGED
jgi:hypothetical protein